MFYLIMILLCVAAILYGLGSAMFYMLSRRQNPQKMATALTWRVGLSFALFALLLLGFSTGLLHPHALG